MDRGFIAIVTTVIHSTIDRVWKALTDPEQIAQYMMGARVTTDWKEGSPITWQGEWQGKPFEDKGRVLIAREPELLKYGHTSGTAQRPEEEHIVTIELKEVGGVTHVRLTQDNNPTEEARKHSEENWTLMLDGLKKMLGEAPVPKPVAPRA
jgi:uncharacterized protein YndB with AHSA1/START domain